MRYLILLMSVVVLSACNNNYQEPEEYMRRFAFTAYRTPLNNRVLESIQSDSELREMLFKSGVVNIDYCRLDSIYLLLLDMKESYNLEACRSLFDSLSEQDARLEVLARVISGDYALLDRIYKMEQKHAFQPEEGQLIPRPEAEYARFILSLEIINDTALAKEYVSVHGIGKAWPEITQNMKTVGIHEMELYLTGFRAFLIMDTKPDFDWDVDGKLWSELPREKEWQTYVAKFQKTDPDSEAAEKWKAMQVLSLK